MEPIDFPGRQTHLQVLDANDNQLHGHLPLTLAGLDNLTSVDLSHNYFSGSIPFEYGAKVGRPWRYLFLNDNFLQGSLPPQFTDEAREIRGSFANNCLRCTQTVPLCRGGQRPHVVCAAQSGFQWTFAGCLQQLLYIVLKLLVIKYAKAEAPKTNE